jgi:hypothetical protein
MQNPLAAKEKIENEIQNGRIAGTELPYIKSVYTFI